MRAQKASVFVEIAVEERLAFCYRGKNVQPNAGPPLGKKPRGGSCIVSPAVMAAMGSILTNKYAEGLPGCGGFLCRVFCAFYTNFCGRLCAEPNKTGANL